MNPTQINLVQESFAKVAPISEQAAVLFYDRLFEVAPTVKAMFPADMTEQRKKLMATLAVVVNGLEQSRIGVAGRQRTWQSVTSAMAPSRSTIPSSAVRCCGRWKRGSARPGRPTSPTPGPRPTARCPVT